MVKVAPDSQSEGKTETTATSESASSAEDADEAAEETSEVADLPLDVTFEILKNRRRRLVMKYLRTVDGTVSIGEVAEHIAAIENDTTVHQLDAQQRKRVYIGLYQCHLPKMDDADVVQYDQNRGNIELGENAESLYDYIETDDDDDETPYRLFHFAGYGAFVALFFAAQLSGVHMVANGIVIVFLLFVLGVSVRASRS